MHRDGERQESEIIEAIEKRFDLKAVVKVKTLFCRQIQSYPFPKPLPDNPEHTEIHRSDSVVELTDSQARNPAISFEIIFQKNKAFL